MARSHADHIRRILEDGNDVCIDTVDSEGKETTFWIFRDVNKSGVWWNLKVKTGWEGTHEYTFCSERPKIRADSTDIIIDFLQGDFEVFYKIWNTITEIRAEDPEKDTDEMIQRIREELRD